MGELSLDCLTGIIPEMSNEVYHKGPGYSATDIITMGTSFAHWKWKKSRKRYPTQGMLLGSVTHLVLESKIKGDHSILENGIAIMPEKVGYKSAAFPEFCDKSPGKYPIKPEDLAYAVAMADATLDKAGFYFQGGMSEPSVFAVDPETGLLLKCRPDYLRDGLSVNFKTTEDASYEGFVRSCANFHYDWQSAYYLDVLRLALGRSHDEVHVCVEVPEELDAPIRVETWTIDDDDLRFAQAQFKQILARIPECEETGVWPQNPTALQTIKLPNYAKKVVTL